MAIMYKLLILFALALVLQACKKDDACSCTDANRGLLCREEFYQDGKLAGYIRYSYNSLGWLELIEKKSVHDSKTRERRLYYDDAGKLQQEIQSGINPGSIFYQYNDIGQCTLIEFKLESCLKREYLFHDLQSRSVKRNIVYQAQKDSTVHSFFDANGDIYREDYYIEQDFSSWMEVKQFDNEIITKTIYEHNKQMRSRTTTLLFRGLPTEEYVYDKDFAIVTQCFFTYNTDNQLIKRQQKDSSGTLQYEVRLKYY